jgi:hypothetical protein
MHTQGCANDKLSSVNKTLDGSAGPLIIFCMKFHLFNFNCNVHTLYKLISIIKLGLILEKSSLILAFFH